jgi:DNA phosphorothioation-dependent restriction protein DptG
MARPRKKADEKLSKTAQIRFTEKEYQELERLAERAGMDVSKFLRANIRTWIKGIK